MILVQHLHYPLIIFLISNVQGSLTLQTAHFSLSPTQQQLLYDSGVAIGRGQMKRSHSLNIHRTYLYFRLRQKILDYFITACKRGPMERSAEFAVSAIERQLLVTVKGQEGCRFVSLCGQVQQSHSKVGCQSKISLILFQQLQHCYISTIGSIVSSRISFLIGLIQKMSCQQFDFRYGVVTLIQSFPIVFEVALKNSGLIMVCRMMQHSISMTIPDGWHIQRSLFTIQKYLNFFQLPA